MGLGDIDTLNVGDIAQRAAQENHWTSSVDDVIHWYKAYLRCRFNHGQGKDKFEAISLQADQLWHAHILHTERYTNDCNTIFGSYLHHTPVVGAHPGDPPGSDSIEYAQECKTYQPHNPVNTYAAPPDITVICY